MGFGHCVGKPGYSELIAKPIESVTEKFQTFLLAVTSLRIVGNLQALSVSPSCLEFASGMVKAFPHPWPGYVQRFPPTWHDL